MQDNFLSSPFFYSLALTLIHFIWQGVLVAAVLKLALMFTSHKKSQLRYSYSAIAMLANLLLPIITFFIIYKPGYLQLPGQVSNSEITDITNSSSIIQHNAWYSNIAEYLPYLAMAWIIVITILSVKLLIELYTVNQLPRKDVIPADNKLTSRFNALVTQLGLVKTPQLIISLKTNVPMAIGWLKPVVLIPASMLTGLTPTQLDMIILHELAHIRRHDYLVNFIQTLVEILLFFPPAVLWVSNQMRNEREYCSDDIAVQNCGDAIAYAHTLADTASLCHKHRNRSIPSMAMAASGGDLKRRVIRLIDHHHCTSDNDASKWLASLVIILSIALVASKQFIQLPHIDFSSGNISLYRSTNDIIFNNSENLKSPLISKNSIAQQLLGENKKDIKDKPVFTSKNTIKNLAAPAAISSNNFSGNASSNASRKIESDIQPLAFKVTTRTDIIKDKAVTTPIKSLLPKQKFNNEIKIANINTTDKELNVSDLLANKKSISELAFARTESSNQLKNPYANQVASLLNEPTLNEPVFNEPRLNRTHNIVEESTISSLPVTPAVQTKTLPTEPKIEKISAKVITLHDPKYPSSAKRKGIELEVMVDFIIDKNGRVKDIYFKPKSRLSYFRSTIRYAMEKWRFKPAQINGKAVESKMSKIYSFSLLK